MRKKQSVVALLALLSSAVALYATISTPLQMQLGNPSAAGTDPVANRSNFLIQRAQFAQGYNDTTREPNWVAWNLTSGDVGSSGRSPSFFQDTTLPAGFYQVLPTDYSGSGFDRGHMCPSGDRTVSRADNDAVFFMSNMIPQAPDNNQGVWASFETYSRSLADLGNEILIISGPSGFAGSTIASGVGIPGYTWKIAVVVPLGAGTALSRIDANTRVIAIKIPNTAGVRSTPWQNFVTSATQIQTDTGYTFFTDPALAAVAATLRAKVDGQTATGLPTISTQPSAQTAAVGGNATFAVAATSNPSSTLTYQWLKNDDLIIGNATATTASLTLSNVQAADAALYTVVVTNSLGTVTSAGASLIISGLAPTIVTPPTSLANTAGTTAVFTVTAAGSPTLTYQWRKGGTNLTNTGNVTGATSATLTLTSVQSSDAASYDVVISNGTLPNATSAAAALAVTAAAPTITVSPPNQTAVVGNVTTLSVTATGSAPFTYQWRKAGVPLVDGVTGNGSILTGVATASLTLTNTQLADAGSFDVVVSNGTLPNATSAAATLTVNAVSTPSTVAWTFGAGAGTETAAPTSGLPVDVTGGTLTPGNNNGTTTLVTTTSASSNSGASAGNNAGAAARTGVLSTAASGSAYFEFTLTPTANKQLTVSGLNFGARSTGTGPQAYSIFSSADNFAIPIATGVLTNNSAWTLISPTITALTGTTGTGLTFRLFGHSGTGSPSANTANWRIDDLKVTLNTAAGAPLVPAVASHAPLNAATGVNGSSPITVTFNQSVTVANGWFTINSTQIGGIAATVTGGPTTYTLTPPVSFADNDTVTVTINAAKVTDTATGTLNLAANTVFSFTTAAPVAPTIATAPTAQSANAGANATFTVTAAGTAPFSYQWRKAGTAITGNASSTTSTLVLTNVQAADAANYDVVISNGTLPNATSTAVALTVTPTPPTITTAPVATTVVYGNNATFTVAVTGTTPLTYQWRKGGVNLVNGAVANAATVSGATGATLTLTSVTSLDAANYDVVITNGVNPAATSTSVALTVNLPPAGPQTNYTGGTYAQTFDTLPNTGAFTFTGTGPFDLSVATPNGVGATGLAGWSVTKNTGSGANVLFKFDTGSSNSGGINSYGTAAATDRALGSLGSGTFAGRFGVSFVNTTGQTLTTFTLGYTGEQWRNGGSNTPNKLTFSHATGATNLNIGTFTAVPALDFTAPIASATSGTLDGNLAANRVVIAPITLTGLTWAPGQTLTLRWTDVDDAGSDDGLAIDDLTFTAAPALTTQPAPVSVASGSNATFTVATSATAATYQWRRNGTAITGNTSATAATLTLPFVTTTAAGNFDCVVTNSAGSTTSTAVALSVSRQSASIIFAGLGANYDGTPKPVTVTTSPAGLPVTLSYAGSATAPTDAGSYVVTAQVGTTEAEGSGSTVLTIAKATQTVSLGAPPGSVAPGVAFTLGATASSGLPVTLSVVSGNATIAGTSVTLADTNPVTLRATQEGNNNYSSAVADTTVSAGKLTQSIAVAPISAQSSSGGPITLSAVTSSGLPATFTLVSGPATLNGTILTLTGVGGTVTVRASQAGNTTYNAAPSVDVSFSVTVANSAPVITAQPAPQVGQTGGAASFAVVATGTPAVTYQWRKDGSPVSGATGPALALANLANTDAGSYDVVVTNSVGSVTSSLARLTVSATATAPVITRQPGNVVAVASRGATFSVVATGSPAPSYQWSKGTAVISGATGATLSFASVTAADSGNYSVVITNSAGTVTSSSASLRVIARSYAGTYFGTLGSGGTFALRINDDNTGVFLAFLPGSSSAFVSRGVTVDDNGRFSFTTSSSAPTATTSAERAVAAAPNDITFSGTISETGAISGSTSGASVLSLSAAKSADTGVATNSAGFYQAGAEGGSAQTLAIVSATGQALIVTQSGSSSDGGTGTVDATGKVSVTTAGRSTISANLSADTSALTATVTSSTGTTTKFTGYAENSAALAQQRIINISTRTTAGIGDQVAIVGFVISGLESKPVLIRAVGPALRGLGVTTALAAPRLELRNPTSLLLANTGWGTAGNAPEIANAAARSGAFPLAAGSADSVILTTLAPGTYTAVISAADAKPGVGLVEIYDLSGGSSAQKLANLSTRAAVGTGEATLISGLVIGGTAPKRVLIRAAGPSLTQFGVTTALSRPALALFTATGAVLAQNSGWSTSADAAAIADASARVGAFAFGATSADASLIVNLAPGAYTAQVTGIAGATGTTLLEVYELP